MQAVLSEAAFTPAARRNRECPSCRSCIDGYPESSTDFAAGSPRRPCLEWFPVEMIPSAEPADSLLRWPGNRQQTVERLQAGYERMLGLCQTIDDHLQSQRQQGQQVADSLCQLTGSIGEVPACWASSASDSTASPSRPSRPPPAPSGSATPSTSSSPPSGARTTCSPASTASWASPPTPTRSCPTSWSNSRAPCRACPAPKPNG